MEPDLLAIARRHLDRTRAPGGEIEDKGEKPATGTPLRVTQLGHWVRFHSS